jgi:two-component system, LytTR family, sensor kinase
MQLFRKYISPSLFGLLIYTCIRLINDTTAGAEFWKRPLQTNIIEAVSAIIITILFYHAVNWLIVQFDKMHHGTISRKRILKEFTITFLAALLMIHLTIIPVVALTDDGLQVNDYVIANIIPMLFVLLYFAVKRSNYYFKQYIEQKVQLEKITNDQLQTELKFLKAQYHPHFLFNALNTVYFQMDENVNEAKKTVEKFSELLRYQLYDRQQTVPISREIHYLKNFIDIQKIRTSERLQLKVFFDESLNGQQVYPLLFLPLVENAFKYAGGDYEIDIAANADAATVNFSVINSLPHELLPEKENGIGLDNLKRRLELLYPGKHQLTIHKSNDTFTASLKLIIEE